MDLIMGKNTIFHSVVRGIKYWGGQNIHLDFFIRCHGKTQMNQFGQLSVNQNMFKLGYKYPALRSVTGGAAVEALRGDCGQWCLS